MAAQKRMVVKSLEEEVMCPLCMDTFTDPKKLPCDHVICCGCLGDLIKRSFNRILTCPVCRDTTPLRGPGASQFPAAHQTNRLIDIYKKTLQEENESTPAPQSATVSESEHPMCSVHTTEALALYCNTCKKAMCRDCAFTSCKKHDCGFLKDIVRKYEGELIEGLLPIKRAQRNISAAIVSILEKDEEQKNQKKEEEFELDAAFDLIVSRAMVEKQRIKEDIEERFGQLALNNSSKTEELTNTLNDIESNITLVESARLERNVLAKFNKITAIKKNVGQLQQCIETLTVEPKLVEGLEVKLQFQPSSFDAKQFLYQIGKGYKFCMSEYDTLKSLKLNQAFKIDIHTTEFHGAKIKASFVSLFYNSSTPIRVTKLPSNIVRLEFTPHHRGRHELHIQLQDNTLICGSPIPSYVYVDPELLTSLGKPKQIPIANVAQVKCSGNQVYATALGEAIIILEQRKQSKVFGQEHLNIISKIPTPGVGGVVVRGQYIYYSNIRSHSVVKMCRNSHAILASVGCLGSDPECFHYPTGISISRQDQIYVCDSNNHRIKVFDTKLYLLRIVGVWGESPVRFLSPYDLVFDDCDNIYVVESRKNRIQILSPQEEHMRFIRATEDDSLIQPVSASIHKDHIYVTNKGRKCISVFTLSGIFVTSFGGKEKLDPECINIDRDGYIHVTSDRKNIFTY